MFLTARTGPPGRAVHFREFSASRGGCIRAGSVYSISRDPPTGNLGWRTGSAAAIARVSRRAVPQNDADRAASTIRGAAGGGRDAENSGFCTVQAGVRWDGEGCPRLFMHVASKIMQDIGHHATDTQIGRAMRRRLSRPFHVVRESKGEGGYGRAGGPVATGLQRGLHLPWSTGRRGRRRSTAACCCLPRTMPLTLGPSISRTSLRSKYLLSNNIFHFSPSPWGRVWYSICGVILRITK